VEINPIETAENEVTAPGAVQAEVQVTGNKKKRKRH
jgi:hypothetical protein